MVPPTSHKVSRVSWYSGSRSSAPVFVYGALTLSGRLSQGRSTNSHFLNAVHYPGMQASRFGLFRVRSPLLTESWALPRSLAATYGIDVSFSSSGYLDVSVPQVPPARLWIHRAVHEVCSCGLPHSDICGSSLICSSPQLFAAYRVLHRLPVPRHPPCALIRLTNCFLTFTVLVAVLVRTRGLSHCHAVSPACPPVFPGRHNLSLPL